MIVKPTVNELLEHTENRYSLVIATSKRARQIALGEKARVESEEKSTVTLAANEIAAGKIKIYNEGEEIKQEEEEEKQEFEEE